MSRFMMSFILVNTYYLNTEFNSNNSLKSYMTEHIVFATLGRRQCFNSDVCNLSAKYLYRFL